MTLKDWAALIHPILAVVLVFPLIGMAVNFAWQTRQRRLQIAAGANSKIPASVGREHLKVGRWLSSGVVGITLVALAYSIVSKILSDAQGSSIDLFVTVFIWLMFVLTVVSLVFLTRAREKHWRAVFATLTGAGLIVIGSQDGVFRRSDEWYISHYYFGIAASLLMIFSLAIVPDIYQDRSGRWRYIHVIFNCFALLLFIGQGITGMRDLFEIGLYSTPQ